MNRMKLWRSKKMSQEVGRQTQVCVWAQEQDAAFVREICARVAEPSERGQTLRSTLSRQLERRRTIYATWSGYAWQAEIDFPQVGPWWFQRYIGGRVMGPDGTHIELGWEEASKLKSHLSTVCSKAIEAWVEEQGLVGHVRDHTAVLTSELGESRAQSGDMRRPKDDAEFAANEASIARSILQAAVADRKRTIVDPSVIEYEGAWGFPSFCQIAHRKHQGRVQFALIHMTNGGSSPTNMVASLATLMRQNFYPKVDPGLIDWFDVIPAETHSRNFPSALVVHAVTLQHANGVYSNPSWSGADEKALGNWIEFIQETIVQGKKTRELAKGAPHDDETNAS